MALGPTGEPSTSGGPGVSSGGVKAALSIVGNSILLNFGTTLSWLSMTKAEAIAFGTALRDRADKLN